LWGRPASGVASKYLLTGILRCGVCGAGLEVRSRKQGARREFFYSCSSYYRRGPAICPNRYEIPMRTADTAVIETLLSNLLTPDRLADVANLP
jgi:site-specific DNA recombinase